MAHQGNQSGQCSICFYLPGRGKSEEERQTHSCPQCTLVFEPSPDQEKNTNLEEQPQPGGCEASSGPADKVCRGRSDPKDDEESLQTERSPRNVKTECQEEQKTRAEFLKYSSKITLDPNTVNKGLLLSEENRKASKSEEDQEYPSHPDRFEDSSQVMSEESLTGCHYFEVERVAGSLSVGVTYKDMGRKGTESIIGFNKGSWALDCFDHRFVVRHELIQAARPHPMSSRVGVYLDHSAGVLSFYDVSDTMTLLHRVQTSFTQPLHVGLWVHSQRAVALMCHEPDNDSES